MALKIGSMYKVKKQIAASTLDEERNARGWDILHPDDNLVFVLLEKNQTSDTTYGPLPYEMMVYKFLCSNGSIYFVKKGVKARYHFEKTRFEEIC